MPALHVVHVLEVHLLASASLLFVYHALCTVHCMAVGIIPTELEWHLKLCFKLLTVAAT